MATEAPWAAMLRDAHAHEVRQVEKDKGRSIKAGQLMLYPSARLIDRYIREIPAGMGRNVRAMRDDLTAAAGADVSCPVTTGKQLRIVAEAAFEAFEHGAAIDEITPVWRVMDERTPALKKLSFDPAFILEQRAREGI
jgi:hypothetical protein